MQQKRLETRSRQKHPRFLKHRTTHRQDLLAVRRNKDKEALVVPCVTSLSVPVATENGSNGLPLRLDGAFDPSNESDTDSEEWWDDPKVDLIVTSGPPAPLDDNGQKVDFLGYFGLITISRRQYVELQRLLKASGRTAPTLLEDKGEEQLRPPDDLQLPMPTFPPEVVSGGIEHSGKLQFLLELDLKSASNREREDSELCWLASEAEKSRRGSNCKISKYLSSYRKALNFVVNRTKPKSVPDATQSDISNSFPPRPLISSICDKLLSLSFSRINGVPTSSAQSCLPLLRSSLLPQFLEAILPALLQQYLTPEPSQQSPLLETSKSFESLRLPGMAKRQERSVNEELLCIKNNSKEGGIEVNNKKEDEDHEEEEEEEERKVPTWFDIEGGMEAWWNAYLKFDEETNNELAMLRRHVANLKNEISSKENEIMTLEERLEEMARMKTSQLVEHRRLQSSLDTLSGCLKGLKTHLRYKKPC